MISIGDLRKVYYNPLLALNKLKKISRKLSDRDRVFNRLNTFYYSKKFPMGYYSKGLDIFEEDWDNLLLLDACRYDMFSNEHPFEGTLSKRISRGACTPEFLVGNFQRKNLKDTIYVTANPMFTRLRQGIGDSWIRDIDPEFYDVIDVWQLDGWDDEYGTVLPETMTDYVRDTHRRYPNKRLLVHYLQPHWPFIDPDFGEDKLRVPDPILGGEPKFWTLLKEGKLTVDTEIIWEAYLKNLRRAFDPMSDVVEILNGKTVITSDHGNMVGELSKPFPGRTWGHPAKLYTDELVMIPWLELPYEDRRQIKKEESPRAKTDAEIEEVQERLSQLGYTDI